MGGSTQESAGIDYFNRGHWLTNAQVALSLRARRKMFDAFAAFAGDLSGKTVLDVGGTPDTERADSNCMIPWLLEKGAKVSLYSPEDLSSLRSKFPSVGILTGAEWAAAAGQQKFDWIISSAVIEHVGNHEQQKGFLLDLASRARGVFATTPARFHWLEFHTKLPFLHWLPKRLHRAVLRFLGMTAWAQESHLNLVGKGELRAIAREALQPKFEFLLQSVWSLGMPSNLFLLARLKGKNE